MIEPGIYVYGRTVILIETNGSVFCVLGCNDYMGNVDNLDKSKLGQKLDVDYDP